MCLNVSIYCGGLLSHLGHGNLEAAPSKVGTSAIGAAQPGTILPAYFSAFHFMSRSVFQLSFDTLLPCRELRFIVEPNFALAAVLPG